MSDLSLSLAFGLRAIPSGVRTAWGARLIWPADLVHDRQDLKGPDADDLRAWLNAGPLGIALARMREDRAGLIPSESRTITLYEDETGVIKADPQGSHGYLYVAAWLKT
jgi:hypothetical protein